MTARQVPSAAVRARAVHGAMILGLLVTAGCGRADASAATAPATPAATTTPDAAAEQAADAQVQQDLLDCLTAAGWSLPGNPDSEQFGVRVAELVNSGPAAAAAVTACESSGLGPTAPAADVPDEVLAEATAANQDAFETCMEGLDYHPQVGESMTITGYGFAFTYPDDETSRSTFGSDVGQCGDVGSAAQEAVIQEHSGGR